MVSSSGGAGGSFAGGGCDPPALDDPCVQQGNRYKAPGALAPVPELPVPRGSANVPPYSLSLSTIIPTWRAAAGAIHPAVPAPPGRPPRPSWRPGPRRTAAPGRPIRRGQPWEAADGSDHAPAFPPIPGETRMTSPLPASRRQRLKALKEENRRRKWTAAPPMSAANNEPQAGRGLGLTRLAMIGRTFDGISGFGVYGARHGA